LPGGAYTNPLPQLTGPPPGSSRAPAERTQNFHPYGDFLLHDIGTGDGIVIAMAEHYGTHVYQIQWKDLSLETHRSTANKIRTAPLWGVRMQPMLMHDGASLTFRDAIFRHRGEASDVIRRFEKLSPSDQEAIVEFLKSL
jgi:CxxC motif-containing protein (DUF1111 family)